jgi:hypothetical protein
MVTKTGVSLYENGIAVESLAVTLKQIHPIAVVASNISAVFHLEGKCGVTAHVKKAGKCYR